MALCLGLPRWAVKPIWILLKQETVSGCGISWDICKSAPCSRQITMPAPHCSVFTGRMPFLPPNQQCQSTEGKTSCWLWNNKSLWCFILGILLKMKHQSDLLFHSQQLVFTARCYASAVLAMGLCPCLCLSQASVLLKRQNVGSHKQHHTIPQGL